MQARCIKLVCFSYIQFDLVAQEFNKRHKRLVIDGILLS